MTEIDKLCEPSVVYFSYRRVKGVKHRVPQRKKSENRKQNANKT